MMTRHAAALLGLALVACQAASAELPEHDARELVPLEFAPAIRGRDGGYSKWFAGRSVWLFGDTPLDVDAVDGARWRTSTFTTVVDDDLADGLGPFVEPLDDNGAPGQLIPFTADELAYNLSQTAPACTESCEPTWVLWPGDLAVSPAGDYALVFYWKIRDWENQGTGIARWTHPDAPLQRLMFNTVPDEPTMLFSREEHELGTAALVEGDTLYVYGCEHRGWFEFDCVVGRAPFASALERGAWEFWDGAAWSRELADAVSVMDAASIVTVHYNAHLGRYLAIYAKGDDEAIARTAPAPEGPWSDEEVVHKAMGHEDGSPIYDVIAHPELSRDDGRVLYLSYSRGTGFLQSEMRLVELTFAPTRAGD
ncbi:MAG: DUF4185 domain-containing protein [Myxococcales bacterium]|nr:DUF4185 domain-containing protein [Myxococcales bacterium]